MVELQAGLLGRAQQFCRRHHALVVMAVLSAAGIATGTTAVLAFIEAPALSTAALIAVGAAFAFLCAYALIRHRLFALFCALAPIPGLIWAAPLAAGADFGAVPFLAYGFGFAAAVFWAENRLLQLLRASPAMTALPALLATIGLMAVLAVLWFRGTPAADAALQAVGDAVLTILSVALLLPIAASYLHFDESFIAEANRAREWRLRWCEGLSALAMPRWGISVLGITAVLIVLGWYGAQLPVSEAAGLRLASVILFVLIGGLLGGGWREGLSHMLAAAAVCLLLLWAFTVSRAQSEAVLLQLIGLASLLALNGFWRVWRYRRCGEGGGQARGRVLEDSGGALAAIGGSAGAVAVLVIAQPKIVVLLYGVFCAAVCGLLLAPGIMTGLEMLAPRRSNVEELYGRKRRKR